MGKLFAAPSPSGFAFFPEQQPQFAPWPSRDSRGSWDARSTRRAEFALEAVGRALLAVNKAGDILWATTKAEAELSLACKDYGEAAKLPPEVAGWVRQLAGSPPVTAGAAMIAEASALKFTWLGAAGTDEHLLVLRSARAGDEKTLLKERHALTLREAEVLLWLAKGKSNRDIGEILELSPRTINKHLEQIYAKLGVENRTAAAAMALTSLSEAR